MPVLSFLVDDRGQDLMSYTLIIAFVALALASLMMSANAHGVFTGSWATAK
jgi:Flp pilus assembly pilin Flp